MVLLGAGRLLKDKAIGPGVRIARGRTWRVALWIEVGLSWRVRLMSVRASRCQNGVPKEVLPRAEEAGTEEHQEKEEVRADGDVMDGDACVRGPTDCTEEVRSPWLGAGRSCP